MPRQKSEYISPAMIAQIKEILLQMQDGKVKMNGKTEMHDNCNARKLGDEIMGTSPKRYMEKRCTRKTYTDGLCKICCNTRDLEMREGNYKKWLGRITEPVPSHAHMPGTAWDLSRKTGAALRRKSIVAPIRLQLEVPLTHPRLARKSIVAPIRLNQEVPLTHPRLAR